MGEPGDLKLKDGIIWQLQEDDSWMSYNDLIRREERTKIAEMIETEAKVQHNRLFGEVGGAGGSFVQGAVHALQDISTRVRRGEY